MGRKCTGGRNDKQRHNDETGNEPKKKKEIVCAFESISVADSNIDHWFFFIYFLFIKTDLNAMILSEAAV